MSWGEVNKINSNMKRPLNLQLRDMMYTPLRIITSDTSYQPEKTGTYKIICVGAGGAGYARKTSSTQGGAGGGGGGVAIKTLRLLKTATYSVTVNTSASFVYNSSTIITASPGARGDINTSGDSSGKMSVAGGTASGGDYNFTGTSGDSTTSYAEYECGKPGSVGVHLAGLMSSPQPVVHTLNTTLMFFPYGLGILNYGGGGNGAGYYENNSGNSFTTEGLPAAVIIIPLEMEE